jgi:hypothetical protein
MIRTVGVMVALAGLTACGDGRGTIYSSERAQRSTPTYVAVTPGAAPTTNGPVLTGPIAVTPGAVPVHEAQAQAPAGAVTTTRLAPVSPETVRFATGPIYSACLDAGRNGATQKRCGCVQWVADRQLTRAQQNRGAGYFSAQHDLQEVRQSDGRNDEEFWEAWSAFGQSAGNICRGT